MSEAAPAQAGPSPRALCQTRAAGRALGGGAAAIHEGDRCIVEAEMWPGDSHPYDAVKAGPYTFSSPVEATRFVTHAVEPLMGELLD